MTDSHLSALPFPIIGIGASAGGLTPIERFFANVPTRTGAAFVLVQHLSPDFKSMMGDLLKRRTSLPITVIEDGLVIQPDHIYLNPARTNIRIEGTQFRTEKVVQRDALHPIDVFFQSLAESQGTEAAAVVLSGTGSDGSQGIDAVKRAGGLVIAQDETTAEFTSMPRSAVATGSVDKVLRPDDMPQFILQALELERSDGNRIRANDVVRLLAKKESIDFSHYKVSTLMRRLERRVAAADSSSFDGYLALLESSTAERRSLVSDLLIGVTEFFRDPEVWKALAEEVIPQILREADRARSVRIWVPACSTGEEAYSIACLVMERAELLGIEPDVKIFATDINPRALERASAGIYPLASGASMSAARRARMFVEKDDALVVRRSLREMVIFARHNLVRDPPFTRMDLVTCRNCLIYLRPSVQSQALASLHYAMRSDGYLLVGPAETVTTLESAFVRSSEQHAIFRRAPGVRSFLRRNVHGALTTPTPRKPKVQQTRELQIVQRAYRFAAENLVHGGLILDADRAVLHTFGEAGRYLRVPSGTATLDAQRLVLPELELALTSAVHRAARTGEPVEYDAIALADSDEGVRLSVLPIAPTDEDDELLLLVRFETQKIEPGAAATTPPDANTERRVQDLEESLRDARENLQTTIEERESANEELVATNEELMASNEELQATNEELQSVNEELHTVNAEHQNKIHELIGLSNDFDNLLRSLEVGVVFLDASLKIRRFTPAAKGLVNIVDHDVGRPIAHLTHTLPGQDLVKPAKAVLAGGEPTATELEAADGRRIFMRVLPFNDHRREIAGVVITFVDTTAIRRKDEAIEQLQTRLADAHERLRTFTGDDPTIEVLVVEDNPGDAKLVEITLGKVSTQTNLTVVENAADAMRFLRNKDPDHRPPDLVLLDLGLPDRDGHELLAEMRTDAALAGIPVAILSASAAEKDMARAYSNRATFYVQKPIGVEQLTEVLRRAVAFYTSVG